MERSESARGTCRTPRADFLQALQSAADLAADDVAAARARHAAVRYDQRQYSRGPNGGPSTPAGMVYAAALSAQAEADARLIRALDLLGAQRPGKTDWRTTSLDQAAFVMGFGASSVEVESPLARLVRVEARVGECTVEIRRAA